MKILNKRITGLVISGIMSVSLMLSACGSSGTAAVSEDNASGSSAEIETQQTSEAAAEDTSVKEVEETGEAAEPEETAQSETAEEAPEIAGLTFSYTTPLKYAECFTIYNYEDGYMLIDIPESGTYFVVPENGEVPEGLDEDYIVLQKPLDRIYLAATSAMALFNAVGSLDNIKFSGTNASGWYIDEAVEAMEEGSIVYAGKYSAPDYESLVDGDCDLAIESTMIYHTPKVKEMIEELDIPVLVDRSSYESHPLGRTEWVKVYAALTDKEEEAEEFFDKQAEVIEELKDFENTGKTVAFFYVNTDGSVVIRNPEDYIPKMIEIAGGKYVFEDIQTTQTGTSFSITMEEFYAEAVDADYLIYNGSIDNPIASVDELIAKNSLFENFKAVKEGNVWTTGRSFYQRTDIVGEMISDVNNMLKGSTDTEMTFLTKVD